MARKGAVKRPTVEVQFQMLYVAPIKEEVLTYESNKNKIIANFCIVT